MPSHSFYLTILFLLFTSLSNYAAAALNTSHDLVRSSCVNASYPDLCVRTLSTYSGLAKTPRDLAEAAVKVTLNRATKVSTYLVQLVSKREKSALSVCVEMMSDTVSELKQTIYELKYLRKGTFRWHSKTWVGAAAAYERCFDELQNVDGKTKADLTRKIGNVAKVTSNALHLIDLLDASHGKSSAVDP